MQGYVFRELHIIHQPITGILKRTINNKKKLSSEFFVMFEVPMSARRANIIGCKLYILGGVVNCNYLILFRMDLFFGCSWAT